MSGPDGKPRRRRKGVMRVAIRGVIYDSVHEAAAALGVSESRVREGIARGEPDAIGRGRGRHSAHACPKSHRVEIGPVRFASKRQAAAELGLPRNLVCRAARCEKARARLHGAAMQYLSRRGADS